MVCVFVLPLSPQCVITLIPTLTCLYICVFVSHLYSVSEIVEVLTGGEVQSPEAADQALLITLVTTPGTHGSRVLAVMFANRDVRNMMLSGFR
jgi:hypothetical protein